VEIAARPSGPLPADPNSEGSDLAVIEQLVRDSAGRAGGENFPVALRLLPARPRGALQRCYDYARLVDEVGDSALGDRLRLLDLLEVDVRAAAAGTARTSVVRALGPLLAAGDITVDPLLALIEANRVDQTVTSYATFADLLQYCQLSAAPVGHLVLQLAGAADDENRAAADRVCAALQVLEHCQDVREDARAGRVYLPADDLADAGVTVADLQRAFSSHALRGVVAQQVERSADLLRAGDELVARLHGWARIAVAGYVAGGLATCDALRRARFDVFANPVTPTRVDTARRAATLLARRPNPPDAAVASAYAECERITREQARNFAWGIRLLPTGKRRALSAVYAFARRIDDIGDGDLPREEKLVQLAAARASIEKPDDNDRVLLALADAARRLPIPLVAFDDLVTGCEMDVAGRRYETRADLVEYCRCVAGSIGRLSLGVFNPALRPGDGTRAEELADALGVALQLTNILRDVREDLQLGRVYLPADDLARFGVEVRTLPDGSLDPHGGALAELVRFEAARALEWYARGLQLLPLLDRRSAACCAALAGIYRELLTRIARDPDLIRHGRTSLPTAAKARIAARALAGRHA
jgi:phytoene synthase